MTISRRHVLALGAGAGLSCLAGPARAAQAPVVVELFTSQGCSSCPPADAFLTELRAMPGVIALTYHVDYWDYLGWKDTLGGPEFSQRQYDYAKARGDMDVYTPQMIVNGEHHFVGSQKDKVRAALEEAQRQTFPIGLALLEGERDIAIEIGAGAVVGDATLWVLPLAPRMSVKILKGEIAGREIEYHNVVRKILPAGMWTGKPERITLPKAGVFPPECTGCVALLQKGKVGPVLGAAVWGDVQS